MIQILNVNIDIPELNKQQLNDIDNKIDNIKKKFHLIKANNDSLSNDQYLTMYNFLHRILDKLGALSTPAFNQENEIEDLYISHYKHAPELGRTLYLECITKIHKPYDRLKNHAHDLIDEIEEYYIEINNSPPPEISEGELLYS